MTRALVHLIGTFFGSGYAPIAPATAGSLLYAVLWFGAWTLWGPIPIWIQLVALVLVTAVGIWAAERLEREHGEDPGLCVIDEVAGMQVTYLWLSGGPLVWLGGFLWFRFFDILKPFGVRKLEQLGGGGGVGIMADDLGAGLLACLATHASVAAAAWLGFTL